MVTGTEEHPTAVAACSKDDCDQPPHGLGLCKRHHAQHNYAMNRDARRAQQATYRAQRLAENRARVAKWRAENPEKVKANNARSYVENTEHHLEYRKSYREAFPDKVRANNQRRRAAEKGAPVRDLTAAQWRRITEAFDHRCAYCAGRKPLTQDHVVALTRGGSHTASNVVPACQPCNSAKGNRPAPPFHPMFRDLEVAS